MNLINEEDDFSLTVHNFFHDSLESFLEFTLILGSCDKGSQVEGINLSALQVLGHIPINDLLRNTL